MAHFNGRGSRTSGTPAGETTEFSNPGCRNRTFRICLHASGDHAMTGWDRNSACTAIRNRCAEASSGYLPCKIERAAAWPHSRSTFALTGTNSLDPEGRHSIWPPSVSIRRRNSSGAGRSRWIRLNLRNSLRHSSISISRTHGAINSSTAFQSMVEYIGRLAGNWSRCRSACAI